MKRVFIVGLSDDKEKSIRFLQETGVLHVESYAKLSGEAEKQNNLVVQEVRRVGQVYESIRNYLGYEPEVRIVISADEILPRSERALEDLQEVRNRKQSLEKIISDLRIWGNANVEYLTELEKNNVFIQRFRAEGVSASELSVPDYVFVEVVSEKPSLQFFTVSLGHSIELPWAISLRRPEQGLKEAKEEFTRLKGKESAIIQELSLLAQRIDEIKKQYLTVLSEANFTECLGTLYTEELLFGLQGWVPEDAENRFIDQLKAAELPILVNVREPQGDETPPTLFKNNWFIRRVEPLLKLYGLPGYRALDPSYFFAPFMILFFGICLGDAGYGAVFLLASLWIRKKFGNLSRSLSPIMKLCEVFSISAIVIGLITGSVFGYRFSSRDWILLDLDQQYGDPMILFYISLGLGVIHLSLSYLIAIFQAYSRSEQLQKLGLMGVLWGGVCLISQRIWFSNPSLMLSKWFYYGGLSFLACGLLLTFLFASDSKKIATRLGLGLWSIYGLTGLVGDLLSYARLFGLGMATTAIASVMNDLAGMVHKAAGTFVGAILAILILILGHTFNLLLSILGSTVHSARLHFVEAFKSFFQGGGTEYKPFKVERG